MKELLPQTLGKNVQEGHLGGFFVDGDPATYFPLVWEHLVNKYNVKSVVDIGCGMGYAARFFKSLGCDILGIDGSVEAKDSNLIPENFRFHDYETGSALNDEQFDLAWSCEFIEHVYEKYAANFINDFAKCKYLAVTYAKIGQGGHHHVNENTQEYWIAKMAEFGFEFLEEDTNKLREKAKEDSITYNHNGEPNHFMEKGLFFKNTK